MNLLTKTNLNFLSISLFVFLIGIIVFYYLLRKQVDENINQDLKKQQQTILAQLESVHQSGRLPDNKNQFVIINPGRMDAPASERYTDTLIYLSSNKAYVPYRKLQFNTSVNNQSFDIQLFKSLEETDMLIVRIFLIMTFVVVIIIISLLVMNWYISLKAWKGFYDTIEKIKKYDVNQHDDFILHEVEVKEFKELNNVLISMTNRIRGDYINLKEYTENASHEIQTPLAIISSKMEVLLQNSDLNEKQYKAVADAYNASNRLSRLNKTLILLAKIENRQFPDSKKINVSELIENHLELLEDLIENKKLKLTKEMDKNKELYINPYLADVLIMNILKNAIRHNYKAGEIMVFLNNESLQIKNTGDEPKVDTQKLFQRFYKVSTSSESTGLGLALVNKICNLYGYDKQYVFENSFHSIKIGFNQEKNEKD